MGCDIHLYIEYRERGDGAWSYFGKRINPGRNYALFDLLAGVRREVAVYAPRGYPADAGWIAGDDNYMFIDEEAGENCATPSNAARYVEKCGSHYKNDHTGKPSFVSNPDWHTHSHLTAAEFREVLTQYHVAYPDERDPEYDAVLAAIESFERGGYDARVVFWFDN